MLFPPPGNLANPGTEPVSSVFPALKTDFLSVEPSLTLTHSLSLSLSLSHTHTHTHTHTMMEYYSTIKKNGIWSFLTTWMDPEGIMLSEIRQTEKDKYCMFSLIGGI